MHPAKATLHSAKPLPGAALGKSLRQKISRQIFLCRVLFIGHPAKTLPSANPAPAKKSGRYGAGSVIPCFAGCHVRGTWQRFFYFFSNFLCRVPCRGGTRQRFFLFYFIISLPGVAPRGHPAKSFLFFFVISLPGARSWGTRQRIFFFEKTLPGPGHPAKPQKKNFYFVF